GFGVLAEEEFADQGAKQPVVPGCLVGGCPAGDGVGDCGHSLLPDEGGTGSGGGLGLIGLCSHGAEQDDLVHQLGVGGCQLLDDQGAHGMPDNVSCTGGGLGLDDLGQLLREG